jgi:hypothetical protein
VSLVLPPAEVVMWRTGTPDVTEGKRERFWCATRNDTHGKVYHRSLEFLNRYVMPCTDQCEPSADAEPVPNSDGDFYWSGWHEEACENCDTQWAFSGEVVAWMRLPRFPV